MIDFSAVRAEQQTIQELAEGLSRSDLAAATDEMTDDVLRRVADCTDADVTFVPRDPVANDEFAATATEVDLAWTLGHVVVHLTASAEEAAFIAAELARGVAREGRSRYETAWPTVTTIAAVRERLQESRRMIHATLAVWPDRADLAVTIAGPRGPRNAVARFLSGLSHSESQRDHVSEIVRHSLGARS